MRIEEQREFLGVIAAAAHRLLATSVSAQIEYDEPTKEWSLTIGEQAIHTTEDVYHAIGNSRLEEDG